MMKYFCNLLLCLVFSIFLLAGVANAQQKGVIEFSKTPFTGSSPVLTSNFQAGDHIYSKIVLPDTCRVLCKKNVPNPRRIIPEIKVFVNGTYKYSMNVTLTGDKIDAGTILMDVAPDPSKMVSYTDEAIKYHTFGPYKDGPVKLTNTLSELSGKNTVKLIFWTCYQDVAVGEFTIDGDFSKYKALLEQLKVKQ